LHFPWWAGVFFAFAFVAVQKNPRTLKTILDARIKNGFTVDYCSDSPFEIFSRVARMSEPLHADVRGPILTGFGKRPLLHPAHHVLRLTGMSARTCGKRSKLFSVIDVGIQVLLEL
jgi:hypothetical protein